jgi:hypothetical protein
MWKLPGAVHRLVYCCQRLPPQVDAREQVRPVRRRPITRGLHKDCTPQLVAMGSPRS